jgi:hypothetical protein
MNEQQGMTVEELRARTRELTLAGVDQGSSKLEWVDYGDHRHHNDFRQIEWRAWELRPDVESDDWDDAWRVTVCRLDRVPGPVDLHSEEWSPHLDTWTFRVPKGVLIATALTRENAALIAEMWMAQDDATFEAALAPDGRDT